MELRRRIRVPQRRPSLSSRTRERDGDSERERESVCIWRGLDRETASERERKRNALQIACRLRVCTGRARNEVSSFRQIEREREREKERKRGRILDPGRAQWAETILPKRAAAQCCKSLFTSLRARRVGESHALRLTKATS